MQNRNHAGRRVPLLGLPQSRCLPDGLGDRSAVKTVRREHLRVLAAMRKRGQSERDPFHGKIQTGEGCRDPLSLAPGNIMVVERHDATRAADGLPKPIGSRCG